MLPLLNGLSINAPKRSFSDAPKPKKAKKASFLSIATVDVLGALKGQILRGIGPEDERIGIGQAQPRDYEWVKGVVIQVVTGGVKPQFEARQKTTEALGIDGWVTRLAAAWSISHARARELIDVMSDKQSVGEEGFLGVSGSLVAAAHGKVHEIDGEAVTFRILEPGVWGLYDNILALVASGEAVSPPQLYQELLEGKKRNGDASKLPGPFAMRRSLFVQAASSGLVEHAPGDRIDVHVCGVLSPNFYDASYYDVAAELDTDGKQSKLRIQVPPSRTHRFTATEARTLVAAAAKTLLEDPRYAYKVKLEDGSIQLVSLLDGLDEARMTSELAAVFDVLSTSTIGAGALKSLLQKALRYGAKYTELPDGVHADTRIVVLVTIALLYTIKSVFVPDLGTHVRGCTNAAKRLAVIMVEDAWPRMGLLRGLGAVHGQSFNPGTVLSALLGVALVTARVATYEPDDSVLFASLLVGVACHQSEQILDWRGHSEASELSTRSDLDGMQMAARLLRIVRSFDGDMNMMDSAAKLTRGDGTIRVMASGTEPVGIMPLRHMIDQHVYRGMGFTTADGDATFQKRHATMFQACTGWNPRLQGGEMLDETSPVVTIVRQQQRMIETVLLAPPVASMTVNPTETLSLPLDRGILAAGVGPIAVTVTTTKEENLADGFPKESSATWKLLGFPGPEDRDEVIMHSPNVRDNDKKPAITKTAKAKAIAEVRRRRYPFQSPVLPGYTTAAYVDGSWTIESNSGLPPIVWNYEAVQTIDVPYAASWILSDDLMDTFDPSSMQELLRDCLSFKDTAPTLAIGYEASIQRALDALAVRAAADGFAARTLQLRLLAMIRGKYFEVALPTPGRDGGLGSDQLLAMDGDWLVYLTLLKIAHVAPGALRPKMAPKFAIGDARLLRAVEQIVAHHLAANPDPAWAAAFAATRDALKASFGTPAIEGREPFEYQTALVQKMLHRDATAVVKPRGHFVSLDTGLGKSITAALYMLEYGALYGNAARVVWFTPKNVVDTALKELQTTWGLGGKVGKVDPKMPNLRYLINIVAIEKLSIATSRGALEQALLAAAETSFAVVDEVHLSYRVSIRTSTIRSFVEACPRFVAMTATPTPSRGEVVGEQWIADSVGFPLTKHNFLVGAAQMVAAKVTLPIESVERLLPVTLSTLDAGAHMRFLQDGGKWSEAAAHVRRATFYAMAAKIVELADADRAIRPDGGVLVFMDNDAEAEIMRLKLTDAVLAKDYTVGARAGNELNAIVGIAITTRNDTAGYNFVRMGAIVTGVYAQSAASRHQLRGRIRRIGQERAKVEYWTVYPRNTILSMLFERHNSVDAKNTSLEQLAIEFKKNNSNESAKRAKTVESVQRTIFADSSDSE